MCEIANISKSWLKFKFDLIFFFFHRIIAFSISGVWLFTSGAAEEIIVEDRGSLQQLLCTAMRGCVRICIFTFPQTLLMTTRYYGYWTISGWGFRSSSFKSDITNTRGSTLSSSLLRTKSKKPLNIANLSLQRQIQRQTFMMEKHFWELYLLSD